MVFIFQSKIFKYIYFWIFSFFSLLIKKQILLCHLVKEIYYYYDETGISAFRINSNIYYYLKDLTGLILEIYNSGGVIVARYVYDAFGNHKVYDGYYNANTNDSFIGNINPFRYKNYYYGKETGLFWLSSRYYYPELFRFIS